MSLPVDLLVERVVEEGRAGHAAEQFVGARQPLLRLLPAAARRRGRGRLLAIPVFGLAVLLARRVGAAAPVSREIAQRVLLLSCHDGCGRPPSRPEAGSRSWPLPVARLAGK